jgi:hypothetical protein
MAVLTTTGFRVIRWLLVFDLVRQLDDKQLGAAFQVGAVLSTAVRYSRV